MREMTLGAGVHSVQTEGECTQPVPGGAVAMGDGELSDKGAPRVHAEATGVEHQQRRDRREDALRATLRTCKTQHVGPVKEQIEAKVLLRSSTEQCDGWECASEQVQGWKASKGTIASHRGRSSDSCEDRTTQIVAGSVRQRSQRRSVAARSREREGPRGRGARGRASLPPDAWLRSDGKAESL